MKILHLKLQEATVQNFKVLNHKKYPNGSKMLQILRETGSSFTLQNSASSSWIAEFTLYSSFVRFYSLVTDLLNSSVPLHSSISLVYNSTLQSYLYLPSSMIELLYRKACQRHLPNTKCLQNRLKRNLIDGNPMTSRRLDRLLPYSINTLVYP